MTRDCDWAEKYCLNNVGSAARVTQCAQHRGTGRTKTEKCLPDLPSISLQPKSVKFRQSLNKQKVRTSRHPSITVQSKSSHLTIDVSVSPPRYWVSPDCQRWTRCSPAWPATATPRCCPAPRPRPCRSARPAPPGPAPPAITWWLHWFVYLKVLYNVRGCIVVLCLLRLSETECCCPLRIAGEYN